MKKKIAISKPKLKHQNSLSKLRPNSKKLMKNKTKSQDIKLSLDFNL